MKSASANLAAALFIAFCAAGMIAGFFEARPFLATAATDSARFDAVLSLEPVGGISTLSQSVALGDCEIALTSPFGRVQSEERRRDVAQKCLALALRITEINPANGLPLTMAARASAVLGDMPQTVHYLLRAAIVTPYEMWAAYRRVEVVWEWNLQRDAVLEPIHRRDISCIGRSESGRKWLARWYVQRPDLKDIIIAGLEPIPERDRVAFVAAVRDINAGR